MSRRSIVVYRSAVAGYSPLLSVLEYGSHSISSQVENRQLEVFGVVLVERGAGTLRTEPGEQRVVAPAIFWLWPDDTHSYGPDAGTTWDEQWALFDGQIARDVLASALIGPRQIQLRLHDLGEMQRLFGLLRAEVAKDTPLARASAGARLHRIAITATQQVQIQRHERIEQPIKLAIEALEKRAFGDVEFAGFAAEFGMSAATLRRKFIATTGMPPKAFQLHRRLDRAKQMLAITATGIETIANQVGFEDAFYFSRLFAQREGMSPSAFRNRNRRL